MNTPVFTLRVWSTAGDATGGEWCFWGECQIQIGQGCTAANTPSPGEGQPRGDPCTGKSGAQGNSLPDAGLLGEL